MRAAIQQKPEIRIVRPEVYPGVEMHIGTAVTGDVPRHWHEEYQLCAQTGGGGQLKYRGTAFANPPGSLNLVEPGEAHSNSAVPHGCDFIKLDFTPVVFQLAADAMTGAGACSAPAFAMPTTLDRRTFRSFYRLHQSLLSLSGPLERQCALLAFLGMLLKRHTRSQAELKEVGSEPKAVRDVRDYLAGNYARKVTLSQLSTLTGMSPFHLARVFTRDAGLPPHAYLMQVRIARAKDLLRQGVPMARVAVETGFADQSHLTRVFHSLVRVSPGAYANC